MFLPQKEDAVADVEAMLAQTPSSISSIPTVGAALEIAHLPEKIDWLVSDQRDLEIQDPVHPAFLDGDWRSAVAKARTQLADFRGRLGIHGPYKGIWINAEDPQIADVVVRRLSTGLEIAGELGATHMVVHSPFTTFGSPFITHNSRVYRDQEVGAVHAVLERLLPLAQQNGCTLVIENIYDTNPHLLVDLVSEIDSPWLRLSVDVGHAFLTSQIGGPPPDQWIREAGEWLAHVHLQDSDGCADRHWRIGQGNLNWYAIFSALNEIDASPRLLLEMRQVRDVEASARWLSQRGLAK